jgi:hypothetical protein
MIHDSMMQSTHRLRLPRLSSAAEVSEKSEVPGSPGTTDLAAPSATSTDDRRVSDRLPFPAEMLLVWNHSLQLPIRYRVIDAGDGGYRIASSLPLMEGTTGMVLRLLPSRGKPMDQPVMVAWVRDAEDGDGYEIGLRCF